MTKALTPKYLSREAESFYKRGDYISSARSYQAAAEGYQLCGDELSAAEMLNNCSVAYLQSGESSLALTALEGTPETFAKSGDTHRQAMAIGNRASALKELERFEEAEEAFLESARILKEIGKLDDRLHVMQSLSSMQLKMGRRLEAYATMYVGVSSIEKPTPRQRLLKTLMQIPYKLFNNT